MFEIKIFDIVSTIGYGNIDPCSFSDYKKIIAKANLKTLVNVSVTGAVLTGLEALVLFLSPGLRYASIIYISIFSACFIAAVLSATVLKVKFNAARPVLYMLIGVIFTATAVLGTFLSLDEYAIAFPGMIALLPCLILDRPWRVTLFSGFFAFAFCTMSFIVKQPGIAFADLISGAAMCAIGIFMMRYTVNVKMTGIQALERSRWNESRYRALLLETNDVVFEYDAEKDCFYIICNIEKYPETDMSAKELVNSDLIYGEDKARYAELINRIRGLRESTIYDELRFFSSGKYMWFSVYVTTLKSTEHGSRRVIGKLTNIDEQKQREERLLVMAQTDLLTGLYNKTTTERLITEFLSRGTEGCHAMMLLDLDDLKYINDTYGHTMGDAALREVAKTLKSSFRHADIIGRVGGDEFMVFLCSCGSPAQAEKLAEALLDKIANLSADDTVSIPLSISLGITTIQTSRGNITGESPDKLFTRLYFEADNALYGVKRSGKSSYALYAQQSKPDTSAGL